jgi:hypothetical protein
MNKLLSLALTSLFFALTTLTASPPAPTQDGEVNQSVRERLVGAWRLAWLEEEGADGNVHRADCTGLLVYTRDGHMSVQVMYRDPQAHASGSAQYAQGGYEASFGRYEVDGRAHTFTFHVEGALVRSLVGKDLTRVFELSGNQMTVKAANPTERWRVAWEHHDAEPRGGE